MEFRYIPERLLQKPLPRVPDLWRRAYDLMESLLDNLTSAARLARASTLQREQRTILHAMIEPLERLVRSLLLSDTIAWLTTTDEGADIMREEANHCDQQPAARPASGSAPAPTTRADPRASQTPEPNVEPNTTRDIEAEIARALDPKHLRFRLADPERTPHATPATRRDPPGRDPARRPNAGLRFARRVEALRLIIANPLPMVSILARHLARRHMPPMDVPTPWTPLRYSFGLGAKEIILARAIGAARYRFFRDLKRCRDTRALPPPRPG
jgi:hypothetical protein